MFFSKAFAAVVIAATAVTANTVTFQNLDAVAKTIYFTGNENMKPVGSSSITLAPHGKTTWTAGQGWIGNFYSVNAGAANIPGMLGEVNFADANVVWYDVSAIVDPNDNAGVKKLWAGNGDPVSGCDSYKSRCNNAYNLPDDIQTKSTRQTRNLFCSVGNGVSSVSAKETYVPGDGFRAHARDFLNKIKMVHNHGVSRAVAGFA